jgi:hypothetical protein
VHKSPEEKTEENKKDAEDEAVQVRRKLFSRSLSGKRDRQQRNLRNEMP